MRTVMERHRTEGFSLEDGYRMEHVVGGLTWPSMVEFSPDGDAFFAEAGFTYPYIFAEAAVYRLKPGGEYEKLVGDLNGPVIGLKWHDDGLLVTHRGVLSRVEMDGRRTDLVQGLPAFGDHHTNHIAIRGEEVFFGQGSVTNTGVVGVDNLLPYGWLKDFREGHDVSPYDIILNGTNFRSRDPFNPLRHVETGPFKPIGVACKKGEVITGATKANSVIFRCAPDGGDLEVYAWGLRNPYALAFSPDGRLICIEQGVDDRGSRPIHSPDALYEIRQGAWHGFPDFLGGSPSEEIASGLEIEGPTGPLLEQHPTRTEPLLRFEEHSAAVQLDFSTSEAFGSVGRAFVPLFGSAAPSTTGGKMIHVGQAIVRVNPATMGVDEFYTNENRGFGGKGPERPTAVRFNPDGSEMWIADYGVLGLPKTGALWKVVAQ